MTHYNLESGTIIWKKVISLKKKQKILRCRPTTSQEFLSLTDQVHASNYRNDKKCQSDGNCSHVRRKRFFLHFICGNELQKWVQHSALHQLLMIWSHDVSKIVDFILFPLQILVYFTDYSRFYRL